MMKTIQSQTIKQFIQFACIAILNTIVAVATMNTLLFIQPNPGEVLLGLFNAASYIMAVLNSYYWNARVTFKASARGSQRQRFVFFVQALTSLGINLLAFLIVNNLLVHFGLSNWLRYNAALGIAGAISSISSFFFIKYWVFKSTHMEVRNAVDKTGK